MNKHELIVKTSENIGQPQIMVEAVWDEMEEVVKKSVVSLSGFGTFSVVEKPEVTRINNFTKQSIIVPAKVEPKFKFSDVFKAQVNRN